LTQRDQLTASALYEWRNYANNPSSNGNAFTANAVLTHALDSTANVALLLGYENVTQQIDYNSYQDVSFGLGAYQEFTGGFTVQTQAALRLAGFNAVNPFQGATRQDQNLSGSINLTKRDWNIMGFAPSLTYSYTRNFSNNTIYDYDAHALDFRLTKNF
jgi:outer membrane protein